MPNKCEAIKHANTKEEALLLLNKSKLDAIYFVDEKKLIQKEKHELI